MLRFRALGTFAVERDGVPVELVGHRQRAVLAILLLDANRVVASEAIIDRLWGEEPPPTAATSLHNAISQLRKALGSDVVETRPPGYLVRVDDGALDLAEFEQLVARARDADPDERLRVLDRALALWRGPPFTELAYEAFVQGEIRRLEELRLTAVEDHIDAELDLGRHARLVGELESLTAAHPHRERLRAQLMLALYRTGRQSEALQAYQSARRTLAEEVGIDPSPALRQLHGAILRQDESLNLAAPRRSRAGGVSEGHLLEVTDALVAGRVVPVLGIESADVATRLADRFRYPQGEAVEVPRVSQYAAATRGYGPLYDELRLLVEADGEPTGVHRFLAALPPILRARGAPQQLLVTTSYGTALERAFAEAGEEVDVVSYIATGRRRGMFCHLAPDGTTSLVDEPNTYVTELSLERRPVVLKLRGGADPTPAHEWESFVVTEDDYIEYLGRGDVATAVPVAIAAALRRSHFLFLGFTVRDWNLRVVLGRMWGDDPVQYRSWAVQPEPRSAERELWRGLDVDLVAEDLGRYVDLLSAVGRLEREEVAV